MNMQKVWHNLKRTSSKSMIINWKQKLMINKQIYENLRLPCIDHHFFYHREYLFYTIFYNFIVWL